jgi:hypothetical protein
VKYRVTDCHGISNQQFISPLNGTSGMRMTSRDIGGGGDIINIIILTNRSTARQRLDKHVPAERDTW